MTTTAGQGRPARRCAERAWRRAPLPAAIAWICCLTSPLPSQQPAGPPPGRSARPEDLLGFRRLGELAWSPRGDALLFTVTTADTARRRWLGDVWLWDARGARALIATPGDDRGARWSPDGRWIAFLSDADSLPQLRLADAARCRAAAVPSGCDSARLTSAPDGVGEFDWAGDGAGLVFTGARGMPDDTLHRPPPTGDPMVVPGPEAASHLWRVDVATRRVRELAHIDGALSRPRARPGDAGGSVLVERRPSTRADDEDLADLLLIRADGGVEPLARNPGNDRSAVWSDDGRAVAFLTAEPDANTADVVIAIPGRVPRMVGSLSGLDASSLELFASTIPADSGWTAAAILGRGVSARAWTSPLAGRASVWTPDTAVVSDAAWSPDRRLLATIESSPDRPPELWLRDDGGGGAARRLTTINPLPYAPAATQVVHWRAPDGLALEGVLVTPSGWSGAPLPTLVRIHGGPYGRYDLSFDHFAQLLAASGFAVFEPNFRGSAGYGEPFSQMVRADYGGRNQLDILSGLDALILRGVADRGRLGVYGWSFGGFSTDWMVTQTTRFRAAVAGAGMSDLLSHYGTSDIQRYREYMSNGAPWDTAAARYLWERSPLRLANRVRTPLLLLHGERDRRVAPSQSDEMFTALRRLGAPVELVRYPREPHVFREPLHQVDRDRRIVVWMARYLTPM